MQATSCATAEATAKAVLRLLAKGISTREVGPEPLQHANRAAMERAQAGSARQTPGVPDL